MRAGKFKTEEIRPTPTAAEALAAITTLRGYLQAALVCDGCVEAPMFGCISCQAVALDLQLEALANCIEVDAQDA